MTQRLQKRGFRIPSLDIWGTVWLGLLIISSILTATQGSTIPSSSPTAILASLRPSPYRTIYPVLELESRTWAYSVEEIEETAFGIIDDACMYLAVADKQCESNPSSCRSTMLSVENFENAVKKSFEILFLLQRLCDVGNLPQSQEAIKQCRGGKSWRMKDFNGKKYEFLDEMLGDFTTEFRPSGGTNPRETRSIETPLSRHPRLAFFLPVVIGLAIGGGVIGTAAITSKIVAEEESRRVVQQIKAGRQVDIANSLKNNFVNYNFTRVVAAELDVIRMTEAISAHATVLVHNSEDLKQELVQLVSREEKLKYNSAFAEEYWSAIKSVNVENGVGLTNAEVNRKTRLSADLSTLVTTLSPINNSSAMCRNQVLTKTLLVPVVDHHRRTEIEIKGNRMVPRNTPMMQKNPHYFIIPENSVMSRETDLFGRGAHVVGRVCTASSSINASATTSTEAISESFRLEFQGTLVINETCGGRNGNGSTILRVESPAIVTVPIFCAITSDRFSCGAVRIRSGDTKLVHKSHHRTVITQDNLVEEKVTKSNISFVSDGRVFATGSSPGPASWFNSVSSTVGSHKAILITVGVAVILLAIVTVPARRMWKGASGMGGVNIYNANNNANDMEGGVANMHAEQNLPALPAPAAILPEPAAAALEEEEEQEEMEVGQLEVWQILKKPVHLRTPAERIAADDWARSRDPRIRVPGPDQNPFQIQKEAGMFL